MGKLQLTTTAPFGAVRVYRGQTEVRAYPHSKITLEITPIKGREFTQAKLETAGGKSLSRRSGDPGKGMSLSWKYVTGNRVYYLKLTREQDHIHSPALPLRINEISNQPPTVQITRPAAGLTVSEPTALAVHYLAKDDASLKRLGLVVSNKKQTHSRDIKSFSGVNQVQEGEVLLNLRELDFFPGDTLTYYVRAEDVYGLTAKSQTHSITYQSIYDSVNKANREQSALQTEVGQGVLSLEEIGREVEKMEILAERGEAQEEDIESFAKKVKDVEQGLESKAEEVQSAIEELEGDNISLNLAVTQKLLEIKKNLDSLDRDFLEKMTEAARKMMEKANLSQQEILDFFKEIRTEDLEKKLDEVLGATRQLKKMQQHFKLEVMANQLYEYHQDLISEAKATQSVATYNAKKKDAEILLEEFVKGWHQTTQTFSNRFSQLKEEGLFKEMGPEPLSNLQKSFKDFQARSNSDKRLEEFSEDFADLRDTAEMWGRQFQTLDKKAIFQEIDKQVLGLSFQGAWLRELFQGRVLDLKLTKTAVLKEKVSLFISEMESTLKASRRELYKLVVGQLPGVTSFFDLYDDILVSKKKLKKKIDPASSDVKVNNNYLIGQMRQQRESYLVLAHRLIQLKNLLQRQQQRQEAQKQMHQAGQRQQRLNQRTQNMLGSGELSPAQQQYLRQSAKEQALIRSMLEGVQENLGDSVGDKKSEAETEGARDSSRLRELKELVRDMEALEGDLTNYRPGDRQKIVKKQKKIEDKFLKFDRGLANKPQEKEDQGERKSEIDRSRYVPPSRGLLSRTAIKQLEADIRIRKYPPEYKERVLHYLRALKLSLE